MSEPTTTATPLGNNQPTPAELQTLFDQLTEMRQTITAQQRQIAEQQQTIRAHTEAQEKRQVNFLISVPTLDRVKREATRNGITQNKQLAVIVETWAATTPEQ